MKQNTQNIVIGLAIVLVAVAAMLPTNRAQTATNLLPVYGTNTLEDSLFAYSNPVFQLWDAGECFISINLTNGEVYMVTNLTLNTASKAFWTNLSEAFPDVRRAIQKADVTNTVNELVTSGEFCRVRGHVWKDSTQDYINEQQRLLMFTPRVPFEQRTCGVCGTNQFRSMPPWPGAEAAPLPNFTNLCLTVPNMVMTNITVLTNLFQYYDGGTNNYIPLNDFVERRDLPH